MNTNISGNGVLIRKGTNAILPISDAQYIQYHNSNLTTTLPNTAGTVAVENVKDGLDALYNEITNASPMTEITYANLVTAKTNGTLNPGSWYRITDYATTTTQASTQSANHPFDVIVLATSANTLSEEARAIQHSGDTYFANSNLNAWKIWYCLENNKVKYSWADDSVDESTPASITVHGKKAGDVVCIRNTEEDIENFYAWTTAVYGDFFTDTLTPTVEDNVYTPSGEISLFWSIVSYTPGHEGTGPNGRGVIYRMIDEFNNDIKYDFKNIQFKRTITNGQYDENGTETWCYTLNVWYNNTCQDASIVGNTLPNDEGFVTGVYDNNFGYATAYDLYIEGVDTFAFALGNNVILSFNDGEYYGIFSNTIGNDFHSNTIGNNFHSNTIGNDFNTNTIGNNFFSNTIRDTFSTNTIGNDFFSNTIRDNFHSNTIGDNFSINTIGNNFFSNTIGDDFNSNTIGNGFNTNTIGDEFNANTIGNIFSTNTIGNDFNTNTIGNKFSFNTIGARNGNTITTIDYVRYIRVEDGVQFVDITTSATTSANAYLQNITIAQGVSGTYQTTKTITHPTAGDTILTEYKPANSRTVSV